MAAMDAKHCRQMRLRRRACLSTLVLGVLASCAGPGPLTEPPAADRAAGAISASTATAPVPNDPDDPAIWVNGANPAGSLIIATDKQEGVGGLYVFGLDGRLRQAITPMDRPNNVDVEYGLTLVSASVDIAVATERMRRRLRVFRIDRQTGRLDDISSGGGIAVLDGMPGESGEPMGIALYKRPADGAVFAIVSPKTGGARDYLWQYRLHDDGHGRVAGTLVRRFGNFSGVKAGAGEIEAVVVDDEPGFVYYADERLGIRKWAADPGASDAGREKAVFGTDGYRGDREGLAIYRKPGGGGYILSSDQVPRGTRLHVFARSGEPQDPHRHRRLAILDSGADDTDGIDVASTPIGPHTAGLLVMMNSGPRNFLLFDWRDVEAALAGKAERPF
jgi:3-phytase